MSETAAQDVPADTVCAFVAALPARWKGQARFVILDDGFDGGRHFDLIRDAWRIDPNRCAQLHVITLSGDIVTGLGKDISEDIGDLWPPITPNLHRLAFDGGRLQWLLVPTPGPTALRELVAQVDVFRLATIPTADEHEARRMAKALARLARVGTLVFFDMGAACVDDTMRRALRSAGFAPSLDSQSTPSGTASAPMARWHYAPPFEPGRTPSRTGARSTANAPVLIVGAGLAGCATAWALAEQGRKCIVFERHATLAMETSGNPAGLFHGIVNPQDGAHARFNRTAALEAQRAVAVALTQHGVSGSIDGLLRLETSPDNEGALQAMRDTLVRLRLPPGYVQALSISDSSARAGIALKHSTWWYPGGGWVQPGGLARSFLERAALRATARYGCAVESLTRDAQGWQLRNAHGDILAQSDTVVLANAGDALRLLRPWMPAAQAQAWPLLKVRGQISTIAADAIGSVTLPRVPITGAGYLLPEVGGLAIFGATSQAGDNDPAVRCSDHLHNLAQLSRLTGEMHRLDPGALGGRTGWRWATDDRMPVLGGVPDWGAAKEADRIEQPRQVPRLNGLYACTAFGSRGITWSALAAQVVACAITGAPMPIEAGLLDSVDAARFVVRAATRRGRLF